MFDTQNNTKYNGLCYRSLCLRACHLRLCAKIPEIMRNTYDLLKPQNLGNLSPKFPIPGKTWNLSLISGSTAVVMILTWGNA